MDIRRSRPVAIFLGSLIILLTLACVTRVYAETYRYDMSGECGLYQIEDCSPGPTQTETTIYGHGFPFSFIELKSGDPELNSMLGTGKKTTTLSATGYVHFLEAIGFSEPSQDTVQDPYQISMAGVVANLAIIAGALVIGEKLYRKTSFAKKRTTKNPKK